MSTETTQQQLQNSLQEFERSLGTPVVSGELMNWLQNLQRTSSEAARQILRQLEHEHPPIVDRIQARRPELTPQMDQLERREQQLREALEQFSGRLQSLTRQARLSEGDDEAITDFLDELVTDGLEIVVEARRQETVLATWYLESFERVNGGGD